MTMHGSRSHTRLAALAVTGVVWLLATTLPSAAATDPPTPVAQGAPTSPTVVAPPVGSPIREIARDCAHSAELQDGRTLWVFCDSTHPTGGFFIENTAAIGSAAAPDVLAEALDAQQDPYPFLDHNPDPCTEPNHSSAIWPTTTTAIPLAGADRVIVYFETICREPGDTLGDITSLGMGVAELVVPVGADIASQPIHGTILDPLLWPKDPGGAELWGDGAVWGQDGFLYVYNCDARFGGRWGCWVARTATPESLASYTYFTGSGWSSNEADVALMPTTNNATPGVAHEVQYLPDRDLFVRGYIAWPGIGTKHVVQFADAPWGPWSAAVETDLPSCDIQYCYAGGVSTALSGPNDELALVWFDPLTYLGPASGRVYFVKHTIHAGRPFGSFDIAHRHDQSLRVAGWVIDPEVTAGPVQVQVSVDGGLVQVIDANWPRGDIGSLFPTYGNNHGFDVTIDQPGSLICLNAVNVGSGVDLSLGCRAAQQVDQPAFGAIDVVAKDAGGVRVAGWAMDADTPVAPVDVDVRIDGALAAVLTADGLRPDVGAAFPGYGDDHGFDATVPTTPGPHQVCLHAHSDWATKPKTLLGCRTVGAAVPFGSVDILQPFHGGVQVAGWGIDADVPGQPIEIHVYIDGSGTVLTADGSRPDVDAAFHLGPNHGFDTTIPATPGTHWVCLYAINDVPTGPHTLLRCGNVVVPDEVPFGSVDVLQTAVGGVRVAGWGIDADIPGQPIEIHVYIDGSGTVLTADGSRPDVDAAFHLGPNHGFDTTIPATPGTHWVCLYAINDVPTGPHTLLRCGNVLVA